MIYCFRLNATHNRAGEITYKHLGGYKFEATIITYTKSNSPADRPSLEMNWGDGTIDTLPRSNGGGNGEIVGGDTKKNVYSGIHIYPGPSVYILFFEDPNRNGGIINIPNSLNIPFYVSTKLIVNPFLGYNNSVQLLNPPIDRACPGRLFIHNPGAWDPDGDSISFKLTSCKGEKGANIPGFTQPNSTNSFYIDPISGNLYWDTPAQNGIGEYNIAILIEEWRKGVFIGSVTRDMQIDVAPCNNQPPVIEPVKSICVDAGTKISFPVSASDSDSPLQLITLTASGGPFQIPSPLKAQFNSVTGKDTVHQIFSWQTDCSHVRKQPWQVIFRASDNGNPNLTGYFSVNVTVVAKAPQNLTGSSTGNSIQLSWGESPCKQATGYALYRRKWASGYSHDSCVTGVPEFTGYKRIKVINGLKQLSYTDSLGILPGTEYCYVITALFSDGAESYPSIEFCISLKKDQPVITHVSIAETSQNNGKAYVEWSRPEKPDSSIFPGPFKYIIERNLGDKWTTIDSLNGLTDTSYLDSAKLLNTSDKPLRYRVRLKQDPNIFIGKSIDAGSVFLELTPSDNEIKLTWKAIVPWENYSFTILRKLSASSSFDSISSVKESVFRDTGLANGQTYCYKIRSIGKYGLPGYTIPFINLSQEVCSSPSEKEPPCEPVATAKTFCDSMQNQLEWQPQNNECAKDVMKTKLFFTSATNGIAELIAEYPGNMQQTFTHVLDYSLAGCYSIVAIDSFMNESPVAKVCTDNCPEYILPNTFSPNGDQVNDLLVPIKFSFVKEIDIHIFNRWGKEIFHTMDPNIGWNGLDSSSNNKLSDGVYYYVCKIYEIRLNGIQERTIKGTIHLFGS